MRPVRDQREKGEHFSQFYFGCAVFTVLGGLAVILHAAWGETWLSKNLTTFSLSIAWVTSFGPAAFSAYPKRTQLAAAFWKGLFMLGVASLLTWLWP